MLASAGPVVRVFFCVRPKMAAKTSSAQLALCEQKNSCVGPGVGVRKPPRETARMLSEADPFMVVQEEATKALLDVKAQFSCWRELSSLSSEMDRTAANQHKVGLTTAVGDLLLDLDDLQGAVDNAAKDPAKFGIAPEELQRRRSFISQTRAEANSIRDTLAAARSVKSARKERIERQGLLAGRGSSSCEMASGAVVRRAITLTLTPTQSRIRRAIVSRAVVRRAVTTRRAIVSIAVVRIAIVLVP